MALEVREHCSVALSLAPRPLVDPEHPDGRRRRSVAGCLEDPQQGVRARSDRHPALTGEAGARFPAEGEPDALQGPSEPGRTPYVGGSRAEGALAEDAVRAARSAAPHRRSGAPGTRAPPRDRARAGRRGGGCSGSAPDGSPSRTRGRPHRSVEPRRRRGDPAQRRDGRSGAHSGMGRSRTAEAGGMGPSSRYEPEVNGLTQAPRRRPQPRPRSSGSRTSQGHASAPRVGAPGPTCGTAVCARSDMDDCRRRRVPDAKRRLMLHADHGRRLLALFPRLRRHLLNGHHGCARRACAAPPSVLAPGAG